jgi:hypothetical protein
MNLKEPPLIGRGCQPPAPGPHKNFSLKVVSSVICLRVSLCNFVAKKLGLDFFFSIGRGRVQAGFIPGAHQVKDRTTTSFKISIDKQE